MTSIFEQISDPNLSDRSLPEEVVSIDEFIEGVATDVDYLPFSARASIVIDLTGAFFNGEEMLGVLIFDQVSKFAIKSQNRRQQFNNSAILEARIDRRKPLIRSSFGLLSGESIRVRSGSAFALVGSFSEPPVDYPDGGLTGCQGRSPTRPRKLISSEYFDSPDNRCVSPVHPRHAHLRRRLSAAAGRAFGC